LALSASRPIRAKEQTGNPKKRSRMRNAKRLRFRTFAAPDGRLVAVVWGQDSSSPVASLDRQSIAGVTPLSEPERDELEQSLQEEIPAADAPATVAVVAEPPLVWPTVGPVSSPFGKRRRGFHAGIDITAPRGQSVVAAADGRVLYARASRGKMGKAIVIQHDDGMLTIYAHLSSIDVREETIVHQGDPIGTVGSTGRSSGPHLHFAVRLGGATLDPQQFLRSADTPLLHVSTQ
jgi:murein DD-endopeptidase MepM/ murein hydrolase activator NlpD